MTNKPSRIAAIIWGLSALLLLLPSCSTDPVTYTLRLNSGPEGHTLHYSLINQRAGSVFIDDEWKDDFESKSEAKIVFFTEKVNSDGTCLIKEENVWSWDEKANDSAKVVRKTNKLTYLLTITDRNEILNFSVLDGRTDASRMKYIESYYKQMMTVFPEEAVRVGHSWKREIPIELPDSTIFTGFSEHTIKGTARKKGYDCIILESKTKAALPAFDNPETEVVGWGVDWIEANELIYFCVDSGIVIHSESKSRIIRERHTDRIKKVMMDDKGEKIKLPEDKWEAFVENYREEFEETVTYTLEGINKS